MMTYTKQEETYQRLADDEVVYVGLLGGVYDLVHGGRSRVVSVRYVLVYGHVKEDRLLRDEGYLRAQPLHVQ